MKKLLRLITIISFALITHQYFFSNFYLENPLLTTVKVAVVLAVFELLLKPIIKILLLPINILTLGTIRIFIDTLGLYLAVFLLSDFQIYQLNVYGYRLMGFWSYCQSTVSLNILTSVYKLIFTRKCHRQ